MKILYKIIPFLFILAGIIILFIFYWPIIQDKKEQSELMQITKDAIIPTQPIEDTLIPATSTMPSITPTVIPPNNINWKKAQKINSDIIGRIEIPDTNIADFFTQTKDNSYYLTHNLNRTESKYGAIFLDSRNSSDFTSENSILYGHNMKDGSMFHNLRYYKTENYFKEHPKIKIYRKDTNMIFQIFSAYIVDADSETIPAEFASEQKFSEYIENCKKRSLYDTNVSIKNTDLILTLVTCSYETDNSRLLVQGKLMTD